MMNPSSPMPRTSNLSTSWTPISSSPSKRSVSVAVYARVGSWLVHQSGLPLLVCSPPSMSQRQSMRMAIQSSRKMSTRLVLSRECSSSVLHPGGGSGSIQADKASSKVSGTFQMQYQAKIQGRRKFDTGNGNLIL